MKNKNAFTLVELIVVITLLAILGTIAFVSLNNYSASARDTKRLSDIRSLYTKLTLENTKGTRYEDLIEVKSTTDDMKINGKTQVVAQGVVNFEAIKENRERFLDPTTKEDYLVGFYEEGLEMLVSTIMPAIIPSTIQLATISEANHKAVVVGNYFQAEEGDTIGLIKNEEGKIVENGGNDLPYKNTNGGDDNGGGTPPSPTPSCDETSKPADNGNIIFTEGTATEVNQIWVLGAENCGYICKPGYTGEICNDEIVDGVCGTSNGTNSKSKPTQNLCANGTTASAVSGTGPWTWTCAGLNGGTTSGTCTTSLTIDGVCGTANNTNSKSKPTQNLCANGTTASAVSGTGPWTWTCAGLNGGTTSGTCTANLTVDGACGIANNTNSKTKPSTNLCANGTTPSAVSGTGPWTWTCTGLNGGITSGTCTTSLTIDGACGTANNTNSKTKPTQNLCANGTTPSAVSGTGPWTWTCAGLNGGTTSGTCTANLTVDGACGTANNTNSKTKPSTNLCANGTTPSAVSGTGPWIWTCTGLNGGITSGTCTTRLMVDGVCGNGGGTTAITTAPNTSLCTIGTNTAVSNATSTWTWNCTGTNGGITASCSRPRAYCATTPTGTGVNTTTVGTPTKSNQSWQIKNSRTACYYTCKTNYYGPNCEALVSTGQSTTNLGCTGTDIIINFGNGTGLTMAGCNSNVGTSSYNQCTGNSNCQGKYYTWANAPSACPSPRRLPTRTELQNMITNLGWGSTSPTGSPYYLTLADDYQGYFVGHYGNYWSSTLYESGNTYAYYMNVRSNDAYLNGYEKTAAILVRCVKN